MDITNEIESRFTYHPPKDKEQIEKYAEIRAAAKDFARMLCDVVPASRERSLALTKLEECVMWSNAGIARDKILQAEFGQAQPQSPQPPQ